MWRNVRFLAAGVLGFLTGAAHAAANEPMRAIPGSTSPPSMSEVLAASKPGDWRPLDPANTLLVDLAAGRVIIELAPRYAPLHVAAIEVLVRARYFDGLPIMRVQDNYVVQWGDPDNRHALPAGIGKLAPEFDAPLPLRQQGLFTALPDGDVYAPEVGFVDGMPAARAPGLHRTWLAHCYGMVGVGRDLDVASGSGAELYVVIGHAPRHLDRNVALVGRVLKGMEILSSLPRGNAEMGFYAGAQTATPIARIRLAADVPAAERSPLEVLRTDTATFRALVESRRNRPEAFFKVPAGRIDVCNVPVAVRESPGR